MLTIFFKLATTTQLVEHHHHHHQPAATAVAAGPGAMPWVLVVPQLNHANHAYHAAHAQALALQGMWLILTKFELPKVP